MILKGEHSPKKKVSKDSEDTSLPESSVEDFNVFQREFQVDSSEKINGLNRELGASERIAWLCDQVGSVNFVVIAHIKGLCDENVLRKALDLLSYRHPILGTRIEIKKDKPYFVSENVPSIPLKVLNRNNDTQWHIESEREINNSLPWSKGPLIRVKLLKASRESDLLITFNHVIGDGMSAIYLIRDLLSLVEKITQDLPIDYTPFPERPSLENLIPNDTQGFNNLKKTIKLLGKQLKTIIFENPQKLPSDSCKKPEDRCAHIIHKKLSKEETASLIAKCRSEGTTVHGAICSALLKATFNQINSPQLEEQPFTIGCMSTVNLRRFLSPPVGEEVGFYVSIAVTGHQVGKDIEFWELAREARDAVHKSIKDKEPQVFVSLVNKFPTGNSSPADIAHRISKIYPSSILITNLGRITLPDKYGSLVLKSIHLAVSDKAIADHFNAAIITYQDELVINFSYVEPILSKECATNLAKNAMKVLRSEL